MRVQVDIPDVGVEVIGRHRLVGRIFLGGGPAGYSNLALLENLIRLTENAAVEYMHGKDAVLAVWSDEDSGGIPIRAALQASTHFETCLSDLHRALNHLHAIRKHRDVLPQSRLKLPPDLMIYRNTLRDSIRQLRVAIQHNEDKILKGEIVEGEPFAAYMTGDEVPTPDNNTLKTIDRIELGPHQIEFATLARAIGELRICAETLVDAEYGPAKADTAALDQRGNA